MKKNNYWIILIFVSIILASCTNIQTIRSSRTSEILTPIDSETPSPTLISTPTKTPTKISTETYELTPIKLPTLIPSPTYTILPPLPTLSSEEAKYYVMGLLENNGNCQLPCWWGITPGETSQQEAERFLRSFAIYVSDFRGTKSKTYQSIEVQIPSPIDVSYITYLSQEYRIRDEKVIAIKTYNFNLTQTYYLQNILFNYGKPDIIGLYTYQNEDMGTRPTSMIIFYHDKGFMIEYVGAKSIENIDDYVRICPAGTYNFLYTWDQSLKLSFSEALDWFGIAKAFPHTLEIQKASNMTVADFYHTYQDPNTTVCIYTPLKLWPEY